MRPPGHGRPAAGDLRGPGLCRLQPTGAGLHSPGCAFGVAPMSCRLKGDTQEGGNAGNTSACGGLATWPTACPSAGGFPLSDLRLCGASPCPRRFGGGGGEALPLGCAFGLRWLLRRCQEGGIRRFPGAGGGQGPGGAWTRGLVSNGQQDLGLLAACDSQRWPAPLSHGVKLSAGPGERRVTGTVRTGEAAGHWAREERWREPNPSLAAV